MMRTRLALAFIASVSHVCTAASAAETIDAVADAYVDVRLSRDPVSGIASGLVDPGAALLPDRSPEALARFDAREDAIAHRLEKIDPASLSMPVQRARYETLRELIEAEKGLRICRRAYWNVSHMQGWQIGLAAFAASQPVATGAQRAHALTMWAGLPRFVDIEIANLREGLGRGYSVPRPVVERVLQQLDKALSAPADQAVLLSPAARASDATFASALRAQYDGATRPALVRYRDFLRSEYLPKARETLGLSALPDGRACYEAHLRAYTTLDRDAQGVFELGRKTVAANMAEVAQIGRDRLGATDFADTIRKTNAAGDNRFASEGDLLSFLRSAVARGREKSARLFAAPVDQAITVEPLPTFQRGSGIPSHYQPSPDPGTPATYRAASEQWAQTSRGDAEVTAMHEAAPGHHLQTVLARRLATPDRLSRIAGNAAYFEGWGRYGEALAEEADAYVTPYARVARRVWPGRGMVADPGLHVFGWTRAEVVALIVESGRFGPAEADAMVDRIAAMPGQMTAYDSGALEIVALRREAERVLGSRFDLQRFHGQVLDGGAVPLALLRTRVMHWIKQEATR